MRVHLRGGVSLKTILLKFYSPQTRTALVIFLAATAAITAIAATLASSVPLASVAVAAPKSLNVTAVPSTLKLASMLGSVIVVVAAIAWMFVRRRLLALSAQILDLKQEGLSSQSRHLNEILEPDPHPHKFLHAFAEALPILFYARRIQPDGESQFIAWNRRAEEVTGFKAEDVIGKTEHAVFSGALAAVDETYAQAHELELSDDSVPEEGATEASGVRFLRADGVVRYLHFRSAPMFDQQGRLEYIVGIGEDVTERRLQEQVLRTSQAQFQVLNDSLPLALFMTDVAGNFTYINKTYEAISGATAQALIGDTWFRCLHPADQETAIEGWVAAIGNRQPYQNVHRIMRPDRDPLWGSFKAVPLLVDQLVGGYVGSVEDITGRLEAERALRASEQRLRLVTDNIPALVAYVTPDQRFEFANRGYQEAFDLPVANPAGMSTQDVLGAHVYTQSLPYIEGALRGVAATFERLVTHVGQLRWERVSYVPEFDEHQGTTGFFSLVEDITELKQAQHTFAKSEMRLRMITDNLPALIAYIDADERYRFCNGYYETILGLKPEKILGCKVEDIVSQENYRAIAGFIQQALRGERVSFERHTVGPGLDRHFLYDYIPDFGLDNVVVGFYSMVLDITQRKNAELKQAAGEKLLRALTDNLPALVGFIDREERFQFNNQRYAEWLDKPLSAITGHTMQNVYSDEDYAIYKPYFDRALEGSKVEFEFQAMRGGESHFFRAAYAPQIDDDGHTSGVCSMISDITALKNVENQLRILARFDSLTGLPNRNHFEEKLEQAIARGARTQRLMAVMFLDVDHFKSINDTLGHHSGDIVLQEVARRLQRCVRKTDTVARLAGDEFTIILEGLQAEEESAVVAKKIVHAMQEAFAIGELSRNVTVSIGVAVRRTDETDSAMLLQRADKALYAAKSAGRNTFQNTA